MAHITQKRAPHSRQVGVSLIEILVGMLIGSETQRVLVQSPCLVLVIR